MINQISIIWSSSEVLLKSSIHENYSWLDVALTVKMIKIH